MKPLGVLAGSSFLILTPTIINTTDNTNTITNVDITLGEIGESSSNFI